MPQCGGGVCRSTGVTPEYGGYAGVQGGGYAPMHYRRGIITDEVLESDSRRRTFQLRKWTAMNKFGISISKVRTSFRGLFFGKFG